MNDAELTGKTDNFAAALTNPVNAATFAANKVPVSDIVEALTARKGILAAKGAVQESCKTSLKTATQEVTQASSELYDEFSSRIDAVAGLVGKKRPLGEQILRLRADLLRPTNSRASNEAGKTNVSSLPSATDKAA
jgi:hypothetical protein